MVSEAKIQKQCLYMPFLFNLDAKWRNYINQSLKKCKIVFMFHPDYAQHHYTCSKASQLRIGKEHFALDSLTLPFIHC